MKRKTGWILVICFLMLIGLIGCAGSCTCGSKDPTDPASNTDAPQNGSPEPIEINEDEVISIDPDDEKTELPTIPPETSEPTVTDAPQSEQPQETETPAGTTAPGTTAKPTANASATPKPTATSKPTGSAKPTATPKTTPTPTPKPTSDSSGDIELPELP